MSNGTARHVGGELLLHHGPGSSSRGSTLSDVTDPAKRERAVLDVLELLPEWWAVGPTSYDPGTGRWTWTARGRHPGRGKVPERITGIGEDELAWFLGLEPGG